MPISAKELKPGDILFKHASKTLLSAAIKKGQGSHYDKAITATSLAYIPEGYKEFATGLTHVAMAIGPDDVVEFDEVSSSRRATRCTSGSSVRISSPIAINGRRKRSVTMGCSGLATPWGPTR